jgi:threonine dehydratase
MGDPTAHGGMISIGCPTVLIGEVGGGGPASPIAAFLMQQLISKLNPVTVTKVDQVMTMKDAAKNGTPFVQDCSKP